MSPVNALFALAGIFIAAATTKYIVAAREEHSDRADERRARNERFALALQGLEKMLADRIEEIKAADTFVEMNIAKARAEHNARVAKLMADAAL